MTTRSMTRLSAGAALVTGIGMLGVATALPAQAETTLTYTCSVTGPDGTTASQEVTVTMDTDAPTTVAPGETLTVSSVTAAITLPAGEGTTDEDAEAVSMTFPVTAPVSTGGERVGEVAATLVSDSIRVIDGQVHGTLSSSETQTVDVPVEAAGMAFDVLAPQTLEGTLTVPYEGSPTDVPVSCTTDSTGVIDTVEVTSPEMDEEPDDAEDTAEDQDPGDATTPVADPPADEPAVPQVVQTDGLTPRMLPAEDHSVGYALGGLLLAGGGAATVLVVRRRAQEH